MVRTTMSAPVCHCPMYTPLSFSADEPFTDEFKKGVQSMTQSELRFGEVLKEHWGYPDWISQEKAKETRDKATYVYGKSESYRHMCRYQSGFFFRHPLTMDLDYYWRVEPGIRLHCDLDYDPFVFLAINNKTYGFTIAPREFEDTVMTLYDTTKEFLKLHPDYVHPRGSMHFISNRGSDAMDRVQDSKWNLCHFWSNFEVRTVLEAPAYDPTY